MNFCCLNVSSKMCVKFAPACITQNIKKNIKIMLGSGSELGGVRVWREGPFFIHTLELRIKRQIFMIFIVYCIYQKGFLKIEKL